MEISGKTKLGLAGLFLAVTFLIYANSLSDDFILDDNAILVRNLYIKDLRLIPKLFTTGVFHFYELKQFPDDYYRPLQTLSYALEYRFWKLNPAGYHATNIALHALNSFLVFLLVNLMFNNRFLALLTAGLFCVHPIQVCMVGYISNRAHLLDTMFMLVSLIAYINFFIHRKRSYYALSLCAYVCALLSWEGAILLPLFILSCMFAFKIDKKRMFYSLLPYAAIAAVYLFLRTVYIPTDRFAMPALHSPQAIKDFIWFWQLYVTQLILPFGVRTMLFGQGFILKSVLFWISFVLASYFLVRSIVAKDKAANVGLSFYFIGLLPLINLTDTLKEFGYILSEHYVYTASIGFFIFIASCAARLKYRFNAVANIVIVSLFAGYCVLTVINNTNYKNSLVFYNHIIEVNPNHLFTRVNLANVYYHNGQYGKAAEQADIVLAENPNSTNAYLILGNCAMAKGDLHKAEDLYKRAGALNPRSGEILNSLGLVYWSEGNIDKAEESLRKAIEMNPESISAMENLMEMLIAGRSYPQALEICNRILSLNPDNARMRVKLGIILAESGRVIESEKVFKEILRLDPSSVDALQNLGALYGNEGYYDKAISEWEKILVVNPGNGKAKEAIERARRIKEGIAK